MNWFEIWKVIKEILLDWGEIFDAFRFIPRIILLLYGWLLWDAYVWITTLEVITTQAAAIFTAVVGAASVIVGFYNGTGRRWQDEKRDNWFMNKLGAKKDDGNSNKD